MAVVAVLNPWCGGVVVSFCFVNCHRCCPPKCFSRVRDLVGEGGEKTGAEKLQDVDWRRRVSFVR